MKAPPEMKEALEGVTFKFNPMPNPFPAMPIVTTSPRPGDLPPNELALIEKMVATLLKLLPNGYRVERVANGVSDKDVCVIVRADIAAVEKPSFDKKLPFTVDPRDQLIADLIKAGNKMKPVLSITSLDWNVAVHKAAESLFDGVVPGDGP